jgi:colanic acid/amylovoran biosynthesis protein
MSQPTHPGTTHIVVVNQHGDNRGDEAAMRAMVREVGDRVDSPRFTIIHQFADADSEVQLDHPATYLRMRMPLWEYVRLSAFAVAQLLGLRLPWLAGREGRRIVEAMSDADIVVSAPGGPYFGDLYANHEAVHWLYVWLAHKAGRPLALYAPSCGPFENRLLNPLRRRGFRWFHSIALRESISAGLLHGLTGLSAEVTTDSALQDVVPAADRSRYAQDHELLLVVSVRKPTEARERHDEAVVAAIDRVCKSRPTSVVLLPQLHGRTHRDAPYLTTIAERITAAQRVEVAPETLDSRGQRALIAAADCVIAGRYHPAVFAISSATPVLVIPYEHKAMGVAEAAGIGSWATWVADLDPERLGDQALALLDDEEVRSVLEDAGVRLRELSTRTSEMTTRLLDGPPDALAG